jgi:hypothetical protein
MITMKAIEAYRTAGGWEEHYARREALQNEIENTQECIEELIGVLQRVNRYLADLNGCEWLKDNDPASTDMRQRAHSMHSICSTTITKATQGEMK